MASPRRFWGTITLIFCRFHNHGALGSTFSSASQNPALESKSEMSHWPMQDVVGLSRASALLQEMSTEEVSVTSYVPIPPPGRNCSSIKYE